MFMTEPRKMRGLGPLGRALGTISVAPSLWFAFSLLVVGLVVQPVPDQAHRPREVT